MNMGKVAAQTLNKGLGPVALDASGGPRWVVSNQKQARRSTGASWSFGQEKGL